MRYHTIKSERKNIRANGQFADYPVYEHNTGEIIAVLSCYASDVNMFLKEANTKGNIDFRPFYK
jgi:hypothetical protein